MTKNTTATEEAIVINLKTSQPKTSEKDLAFRKAKLNAE